MPATSEINYGKCFCSFGVEMQRQLISSLVEASGLCVVTANQFLAVYLWKISFHSAFLIFCRLLSMVLMGIYLAVLALSRL